MDSEGRSSAQGPGEGSRAATEVLAVGALSQMASKGSSKTGTPGPEEKCEREGGGLHGGRGGGLGWSKLGAHRLRMSSFL